MYDELENNGPFEVAFEVYSDFANYGGGVYQHKSGKLEGGHAVIVIGWGVLDGTPYWLIQNSWGTSWGLDGYFMIIRGSDECGIESNSYAGVFV
jgi:C1A family cysteine protease